MTQRIGLKAQRLIDAASQRRSEGRLLQAIAALEDAVGGPGAEELTTTDRVALLRDLAELRLAQGAWAEAHEHLDDAITLLGGADAKRDHRDLWASVNERKAFAMFRQGRLAHARALAHSIREELQHEEGEARTLAGVHNTLAGVAWQEGRLDDALEHVTDAADLYRAAGDDLGSSITLTNRGIILFSRGRWLETEQMFTEADVVLRRNEGWQSDRARGLVNRGTLELAWGRHAEARRLLEEGLGAAERLREEYVVARGHIALAHLGLLEKEYEQAHQHLEAASKIEQLADDDRVQAASLMALLECDRNATERGLEIAGQARNIARDARLAESEADCCRALAAAYRRSARHADAEKLLLESIALADQVGDPYRRALALLELGAVRHESAAAESAREHVEEAASLFQQLGARFDLSRAETLRRAIA